MRSGGRLTKKKKKVKPRKALMGMERSVRKNSTLQDANYIPKSRDTGSKTGF